MVASLALSLNSQVRVYNVSEKLHPSNQYKVEIFQNGQKYPSFVYSSNNKFIDQLSNMTDYNHWTTFAFEGEVQVTITKRFGWIGEAKIYPLSLGIEPVLNQKQLTFTISEPCKIYIEMKDMEEHPLFIFADAPETEIPDKDDPNVIWFNEGEVFDVGEKYPVKSSQTVYIEGGAWVYGTFALEYDAKDVKFLGRGVISSEKLGRRANAVSIPVSTIYGPGNDGHCTIDGITITDPAHFCIITYITNYTSNVKLFGWYYQTDGWGGGDNSTLDDAFMKVNDDNVKVYHYNQKITNLVLYQQLNGAPFQLSWGGHAANNSLVDGVEIVKAYVPYDSKPGNGDLVNMRHHRKGRHIHDLTFRNITADQSIYRILGLNNDGGGTVENITIENLNVKQGVVENGYIFNTGLIKNIQLKNIIVKGDKISYDDFTFSNFDTKELIIK